MADTVTETVSSGVITLTYAGVGASWNSMTHFPGGLKVRAIKFYPSAANDILIVRSNSATGAVIAEMKDTTGGGSSDTGFDGGTWLFPYILITDQTWNTPANVKVMIVIV